MIATLPQTVSVPTVTAPALAQETYWADDDLDELELSPRKRAFWERTLKEIRASQPKAIRKVVAAVTEPPVREIIVERVVEKIVEVPRPAPPLPSSASEIRSCLDALRRNCALIRVNSGNNKVIDATYEMENILMQFWPDGHDPAASADRWRQYDLTPIQNRIADILFSRIGKTVSNESVMVCWSAGSLKEPTMNHLKVQIVHLRRKLSESPYVIQTEWGVGYRMELKPC